MIDFAAGLDLSPSGAMRAADRLVTDGIAERVALADLTERFITELNPTVCIKPDAQTTPEDSE